MIFCTLDKHANRNIIDEGETMIFCTLDKHANRNIIDEVVVDHGFNLVYDATVSVLV
jgi:hypothetical protein